MKMYLIELKTTKITKKGQIVIPKEMREQEGFKEGMKIAIVAFEDKIELISLQQLNEKMFPAVTSQKSLAKDWLSEEDEKAWKNL
jgi:AbrB family looped-hinge helix DNA binding protein